LIVPAAERAVDEFVASDDRVLLLECHYAFQKRRAVTMNLEGEVPESDEAYEQAVDDRMLSRFVDRLPTGFVFLFVEPTVAYRRVKRRAKNVEDEAVTLDEIRERQDAERDHFEGIIEKFDVGADCHTVIDNSGDGDGSRAELAAFVDSVGRSC
jgi:thymidylate kinase